MSAPALFQPLQLRELTLKNRVVVSPMCQYSADHGVPNDWHLVHLGRFALGGAGLVFAEATAVEPEGRISAADTGLYNDEQQAAFTRIVRFLKGQGAATAIQLAHAGRKASTRAPWLGGGPARAEQARNGETWRARAPSALPFTEGYPVPHELSREDMAQIKASFVASAQRALAADFDVLEVHAAHGYLLTQFLSPISNRRTDEYGGDRDARMRWPLEVTAEVRAVWPASRPLFVRISAVDGTEEGWSLDDSVAFGHELRELGVDAIDCSSGGVTPSTATIPDPKQHGYQVTFAQRIKREVGVPTMAVGRITDPELANAIVQGGSADLVALARTLLDDPNWPLHAREQLQPETLGDAAYPLPVGYAVKALKRPPR
ncbi:MAG: oxidoreductase [Polyangiaceae bacterium]|jgi:2,4-dienoyl-CoA reductase-like NADH-dependent reductase (Old Yellow Enzyme family)|nr:oxidoreductase [Polyangiaceae bacterium]